MMNSAPSKAMASTQQLGEIRRQQRADGHAAVLAIGTANPPNCVSQDEYRDYYFRVTKSEHLTDLKHKLKTMCKQNHDIHKPIYHLICLNKAGCLYQLLFPFPNQLLNQLIKHAR